MDKRSLGQIGQKRMSAKERSKGEHGGMCHGWEGFTAFCLCMQQHGPGLDWHRRRWLSRDQGCAGAPRTYAVLVIFQGRICRSMHVLPLGKLAFAAALFLIPSSCCMQSALF